MSIRVLRLIEYVYPDAKAAEEDMNRWTLHQPHNRQGYGMRSVTLPYTVLDEMPWMEEDQTEEA